MEDMLTLQQALEEFNHENKKYFSKRSISKEGKQFMKCHDIAHIVFGCDTTIYGEGVVKTWTTFGTTLSLRKEIVGYKDANAFQLFRMYSFGHVIKNIFRYLMVIPKDIIRAKRMHKKWPFSGYKVYLNTPLSEIRKEFNIQILQSNP